MVAQILAPCYKFADGEESEEVKSPQSGEEANTKTRSQGGGAKGVQAHGT